MTGPAAVTIRRMRIADVDVLLPHEREMFGTEAWTRRGYREELADTVNRYYVIAQDDDGTVLGSAGVMVLGATAQIMTVGVLPPARRRGIGRLLLRHLVAEAVRRGAEEVLLEVRVDNAAARDLYLDEGFVELALRRGYYGGGHVDALTMRRELR